ncbi:hypothetical protein BaRGS_00008910 [Batillaria attramentaria]|uniref:Uncharacterized protein n=1 Tax=Batillaria attramentaria TaxID=370345 RepID=A0ABD0LJX8_9CAEN
MTRRELTRVLSVSDCVQYTDETGCYDRHLILYTVQPASYSCVMESVYNSDQTAAWTDEEEGLACSNARSRLLYMWIPVTIDLRLQYFPAKITVCSLSGS